MYLSLDVHRDDRGATTMDVGGEIDLGSGRQLLEFAVEVMRAHGPSLSVDLAGVTFMDCGGVGVLLAIRSRARMLGGQLRLVSASAPVRRVLEILGMESMLAFPGPGNSSSEVFQRWHCFVPVGAGAQSQYVPSRPRTTRWAGC